MTLKRIALIGGSFNPVTKGHIQMGKTILYRNLADCLVYVPCGFHTEKTLVDNSHRLKMLKLVLKNQYKKVLEIPNTFYTNLNSEIPKNYFLFANKNSINESNFNLNTFESLSLKGSYFNDRTLTELKKVDWEDPYFFQKNPAKIFYDESEIQNIDRIPTAELLKNYINKFNKIQPILVGGTDLPFSMHEWEEYQFLMEQYMICKNY